jgi:hypothetical protein
MRRSVFAAVLAVLFVISVGAQSGGKIDFSGTWKFDASKSEMGQGFGGRGAGGGARGAPGGGGDMVIQQTDKEIVITSQTQAGEMKVTYALDGRESRNAGLGGRGEQVTKSRWEGDKLVTTGSGVFSSPRGEINIQTKETRWLSADGKVMTVEATRTTPMGEMTTKMVYNKAN